MENAVRLNKYISATGFCSRRKADEWIETGKVLVNGKPAEVGMKVFDTDCIEVNGVILKKESSLKMVAFYKPRGYTVTFHKGDSSGIFNCFDFDTDLRYVGRLDKDSEGLLLLTNDGILCNEISKAGNVHEKEYIVTVNRDITEDFLERMAGGVRILDGNKNRYVVTRPCKVTPMGNRRFSIVLTQGYNRQIRRMCEYFDYKVVKLLRIRVMNIELEDMHPGEIRELPEEKIRELSKMCNKRGL